MVDSVYGIQKNPSDLNEDGKVSALWLNIEPYERIDQQLLCVLSFI